jgi:hypothetical protein
MQVSLIKADAAESVVAAQFDEAIQTRRRQRIARMPHAAGGRNEVDAELRRRSAVPSDAAAAR